MTEQTVSIPVAQAVPADGGNEFHGVTYFRTRDVRPYVKDGALYVYNFRGQHRSWGSPSCTSKVSQLADDVIRVVVTGWHKHSVSPEGGAYYFVLEGNTWIRRTRQHTRVKAVQWQGWN
jgi:hypothetical protein